MNSKDPKELTFLSEENIGKITEKYFEVGDSSKTGLIDFSGLRNIMVKISVDLKIKLSIEEIRDVFESVDENEDGKLSKEEF